MAVLVQPRSAIRRHYNAARVSQRMNADLAFAESNLRTSIAGWLKTRAMLRVSGSDNVQTVLRVMWRPPALRPNDPSA